MMKLIWIYIESGNESHQFLRAIKLTGVVFSLGKVCRMVQWLRHPQLFPSRDLSAWGCNSGYPTACPLPHLAQGMVNNGQLENDMLPPCLPTRGIITSWCAQPFLAEFYSESLPATLMMCFKIESAGANAYFGKGTLYQIINPYINPLPSSPPWHLPSRLFCYLLRWPAASCFPPKGKLLPPSALGQGYSSTGTISNTD